MAKFPSIRFKRSCGLSPDIMFGLDGNGNNGLPLRPSESDWVIFRGGIDDVVYPKDSLVITLLVQVGENLGRVDPTPLPGGGWNPGNPNHTRWRFKPITFSCEISCEGLPTSAVDKSFEEEDHFAPGPRS